HFKAINEDISSIGIIIKQYNGAQITSLPLYDDGLHGDDNANDGIWGNDWLTTPMAMGLYVDALVNYSQSFNYNFEKIYEHLATSGPVSISQVLSGSDNLNHDGIANPGENIRYTLAIQNSSVQEISEVEIKQIKALEFQFVHNLNAPNGNEVIPNLSASGIYSWNYSATEKFYQFDIDSSFAGNDIIHIIIHLADSQNNLWRDTVAVWVAPLPVQPREQLMTKISGNCYGQLGYRLIDPNLLTNHDYEVSFNDSLPNGNSLYSIQDLTTGSILLTEQPYPDQYGHNSQVVDGFSVTRGTTIPTDIPGDWRWISSGPRWLTGYDRGLRLFFSGIGLGKDDYWGTLPNDRYHSVKIIFDSTLQTNCAAYRGLSYNGIGTFYGEAYDISDTLNPRRVNIVFSEYDTPEKPADMIWNPDSSEFGGREYLFIMNSDYDPATAGGYNNNNPFYDADVVWVIYTRIRDGHTFLQSPADFYLYLFQKVKYGDIFRFTPQWTGINPESQGPVTFQLSQNYPNPFNPVTHFRFSLAHQVKVKLEIFNVLGQRVKMLVDKEMPAGEYQMQWDGLNDMGNKLGSGLYFYRISAGDFVKIRKMILLK
ncbi:MAG: FlgD immunoglobulin-like domain containing protein, partial [Calditrichota bacterium]